MSAYTCICCKVLRTVKSYCLHHIFQQLQQNRLSLTLQPCGRSEGLVYVGGKEGLQTRTCTHVHTGTDVEVSVYKEGEATEKTSTRTGRIKEVGRGRKREEGGGWMEGVGKNEGGEREGEGGKG